MHEYNHQPSPQAKKNGFALYNTLGEWTPALHVHLMVHLTLQLRNAIALWPRTWGCQWSQRYIRGKPHHSNHLHRGRSANRFANTSAWQRNEIMEWSSGCTRTTKTGGNAVQCSRSRHPCANCWVVVTNPAESSRFHTTEDSHPQIQAAKAKDIRKEWRFTNLTSISSKLKTRKSSNQSDKMRQVHAKVKRAFLRMCCGLPSLVHPKKN